MLVELSEQFKVHANQIGQWRAELLERAAEVFATAAEKREGGPDLKALHAKIGQLALENDFFGRRARSHRRCERKTMIDLAHECYAISCGATVMPSAASMSRR
jgi:hypothetical protein